MGIECHCPEYFKEAEVNTVGCIVNMSAVKEAQCISEQKNINVDLASKSSPDTLSIPCDDNSINSKDHCECKNISEDLLSCTVHIFGNRARDEGKELTCKPCVRPRHLNVTSTGCCEHITFGKHHVHIKILITCFVAGKISSKTLQTRHHTFTLFFFCCSGLIRSSGRSEVGHKHQFPFFFSLNFQKLTVGL